jgi:hypothetical protein
VTQEEGIPRRGFVDDNSETSQDWLDMWSKGTDECPLLWWRRVMDLEDVEDEEERVATAGVSQVWLACARLVCSGAPTGAAVDEHVPRERLAALVQLARPSRLWTASAQPYADARDAAVATRGRLARERAAEREACARAVAEAPSAETLARRRALEAAENAAFNAGVEAFGGNELEYIAYQKQVAWEQRVRALRRAAEGARAGGGGPLDAARAGAAAVVVPWLRRDA